MLFNWLVISMFIIAKFYSNMLSYKHKQYLIHQKENLNIFG